MKSAEYSFLEVEIINGIGWLRLNRTQDENKVDLSMATDIRKACDQFMQDDNIRVVVISGIGNVFCNGDAQTETALSYTEKIDDELHKIENLRVSKALLNIDKPVICAINGNTFGHGLEIALCADIRIAVSKAKFGMPQIKEGSIPWDGGTQMLPRIVGRANASELLLTGKTIKAKEALRIGLIQEILPANKLFSRANQIANAISHLGPIATRYAKEAVTKGLDMTIDQGMRLEMDLNLLLQTTKDRNEGITSFLEKRYPNFIGE